MIRNKNIMEQPIWGTITLEEDEVYFLHLGDLYIWIKIRNGEIWIAYCYRGEISESIAETAPPETVSWSRWAHKGVQHTLHISPAMADRPLIVHSDYSLKVSPRTTIQVFSRVPVWVAISVADSKYTLIELPASKLSKTWFGSPIEGELCYYTNTKARRKLTNIEPEPHLVCCPITISNQSSGVLDFERFCFRVERLGIYAYNDALWSDETEITYRGEEQNSDVIMTGKLPEGIEKQMQLAKPRNLIRTSLATRTFRRFLNLH